MNAPFPHPARSRRRSANALTIDGPIDPVAFHPQPEAIALLAEVLARFHNVALPAVQFIDACPRSGGSQIAREFAVASVSKFGRTLLLAQGTQAQLAKHRAAGNATRALANGTHTLTPDSTIPGLYHRKLEDEAVEVSDLAVQIGRSAANKAFRMLVFASSAPGVSPSVLIQAARCQGSIITVAAGITRLSAIQNTARQIHSAGGSVFGTILFDAPCLRRVTPLRA